MVDRIALDSIHSGPEYQRTRDLIADLDALLEAAGLPDTARIEISAARDLSISTHFYQKPRPDGQPYVNHPLEVAIALIKKFEHLSPGAVIAALLHDSIEDQPQRIVKLLSGREETNEDPRSAASALIARRFGARPAEIVARLTNPDFDKIAEDAQLAGELASADELKLGYYRSHFLEILEKDPEAFLVKLADFSANAFALGELPEGPKKSWLRRKYGPVLLAVAERLEEISDPAHLLFDLKGELIRQLRETFSRDYAS